MEAWRREQIYRFGEKRGDGRHSVYAGGLWVRTSLDPQLQEYAQKALRDGLIRYDRGRGWSGPMRRVDVDGDGWQSALLMSNIGLDYEDWQAAIGAGVAGGPARHAFARPRKRAG